MQIQFSADALDLSKVLSSLQMELCVFGIALFCFRFLRGGRAKDSPSKRSRVAPDPEPEAEASCDYSAMLKDCGQTRDVDRARMLWSEMLMIQAPDVSALTSMVDTLVANGCISEAWELANAVWKDPALHLGGDIAVYSALLRGFSKSKQHTQVIALYDEMSERNIPMNTITYNTVLNSMSIGGHMRRVPEVLASMTTAGPRVSLDTVTFSTMIKGCCLSGDLDSGLELLTFMRREANLRADEFAYNSLLDCCAKQNRLNVGLELLDRMRSEGVEPSNYTMSIAMKLLGRARRLKQAFELIEEVSEQCGLRPNIQVYTCLMSACFQSRKVGKAFELHNKIVDEGHVVLDRRAYTALARGCLNTGACAKAAAVVRCAYHLPCGPALTAAQGLPCGVESACLQEVLAELAQDDPAAADELRSELAACAMNS